MPNARNNTSVVHFVETWLPMTQTWLFNHVSLLPPEIESDVVCRWTQNLEGFPAERLWSSNAPPKPLNIAQRAFRKLGLWSDDHVHLPLLEQVLRTKRPQILHSHFGNCGWVNARLARKYDVRHVVSFYGLDLSYLPKIDPHWRSRYQEMSDLVDRVLCEGPHMARCIADLGVDSQKIEVFRLGIDTAKIPYQPRQNPKDRTKRFLVAGSFREKKGIPYGIHALGLFAKQCPDIEVTVIGDGGSSSREQHEKKKIMDSVDQAGIRDRVRFLGYQSHDVLIREFYRNDVFVSPSVTSDDGDTEGGAPVTIIEAAASGMPVASTTHCDIPFVLSPENRQYLAPERDSEALARAIWSLFESSDWSTLLDANRSLVERELMLITQANRLAQIYRRVATETDALGMAAVA